MKLIRNVATALVGLFAIAGTVGTSAANTLVVKGVTYNVDTMFHAQVGPGTTQTSLSLSGATYPLVVHYLTIDKTQPGVEIRAVCATNKVAGVARTSVMAESNTRPGLDYFCGVNADFFTTSGSATNGSSKVGTPTTSCIVDGEIYKSSTSNYQFSVDRDGVARVCRFNYYTGTATIGEKVTLFKGINVMSPNNGITIYTPRFWGTANQNDYADNCWQVTAKLAPGSDPFVAGKKFSLEVTSDPTADGDLAIPSNGYVIHGRGTSTTGCNTGAKTFVGALKKGDIVEFDNIILTPDGERIYPVTTVSGNPKNVGGGETLDTESERTDAKDRHPRTCIGTSADGNKVIMMVIEGRVSRSSGVSTSMLADVMRYAGAAEAVNLDGGGSSTLYTHALGVRNICSDGSERAVGNAVFAVLNAPEDNEIASISFADWRKSVPRFGIYRPVIYAYNKYGKMISANATGYTLECEKGIIADNGSTIITSDEGYYALKATLGNCTASIPLTVTPAGAVTPVYTDILLNHRRPWHTQLTATVDGEEMEVSAQAFDWSSADAAVATVDIDGTVRGVANGSTTVTGTADGVSCTFNVNVQVPEGSIVPVSKSPEIPWTVASKTAMKSVEIRDAGNGAFDVVFTQSSTRGPRIGLSLGEKLHSHPDALAVDINTGETPVTKLTFSLKAANGAREVDVDVDLNNEKEKQVIVPISDFFDTEDVGVYPIQFSRLSFTPAGVTAKEYSVRFNSVNARYNDVPDGVSNIIVDQATDNGVGADAIYNLQGVQVSNPAAGIYIRRNSAGTQKVIIK